MTINEVINVLATRGNIKGHKLMTFFGYKHPGQIKYLKDSSDKMDPLLAIADYLGYQVVVRKEGEEYVLTRKPEDIAEMEESRKAAEAFYEEHRKTWLKDPAEKREAKPKEDKPKRPVGRPRKNQ